MIINLVKIFSLFWTDSILSLISSILLCISLCLLKRPMNDLRTLEPTMDLINTL